MDSEARAAGGSADADQDGAGAGGLWFDAPVGTPRLPDPVRTSAVRAGLIVSFTLIEAVIALLGAIGGSWITAPAMICTIASTVVATWSVVDVWVTRQVWNQRNGVISSPSSVARALRRERRREHRAARSAKRAAGSRRRHEHLISRA
jgi:hypothetical protein